MGQRKVEKISKRQFQRMVMIELFSMTSMILPSLVVRSSGKGGLTPMLYGAAAAILLAAYYLWLGEGFLESYETEISILPGKWFSGIYTLLYCVRFFIRGLFLMILFSALIQSVLLPKQSIGLILFPVLLISYYAARKNLSVRARLLEMLFYYIFVPLIFVLILALFQVNYEMLPDMLWGEKHSLMENLGTTYQIVMTYTSMEFILFLYPVTKVEKKKGFPLGKAVFFVILLNLWIYIATTGMFGTVRTGEQLWSALSIMQNVRLPGHFLERLDILFLAFWIFSVFALFSGYLFYSERMVRKWKQNGRQNWNTKGYALVFLGGIFLLAVCFPDPERSVGLFFQYMMWIDFPLAVGLPFLLRLVKRKEKRGKKVGQLLVLLFFVGTILSGCGSRTDIEDKNYVLSLGIDAGEEKLFEITYGTANLNQPSGEGEGGSEQKGEETSYEADSLLQAEREDARSDEKELDFGHLKAILISKKVYQKKESREQILKELEEKDNLSGTIFVFLTEAPAKDCIALEKEMSVSLGDYLEKLIVNHKEDGRKEYTLCDLLRDRAEGKNGEIPLLYLEEKRIVLED
ncbi:MAG: GerAB/ArcD/ProY family transporter [Lachnospiraceae bacterium]|nr:GerAB/ArcD/ProY family transporter [Lachnospiraceae bacterium]